MNERHNGNQHDTNDDAGAQDDRVVGWSAASEVARRTIPWLRRHLAQGLLRSQRDENGQHVFSRADLEALRPAEPTLGPGSLAIRANEGTHRNPTDEASSVERAASAPPVDEQGVSVDAYAQVFEDLTAGKTLDRIVVERKLLPDVVERVARRWWALKEADLNTPSTPAELSLLRGDYAQLRSDLHSLAVRCATQERLLGRLLTPDGHAAPPLVAFVDSLINAGAERLKSWTLDPDKGFVSQADHKEVSLLLAQMIVELWPIAHQAAVYLGLPPPRSPQSIAASASAMMAKSTKAR